MATINRSEAKLLNKYYTGPSVAGQCWNHLKPYLFDDTLLIEPSAGAGVFLQTIKPEHCIRGYDIAPDPSGHAAIGQNDFLAFDVRDLLSAEDRRRHLAFVGNPPFGQRSATALAFLNRALTFGELAAFILPIGFRKWSIQSRINPGARLIADFDLPEDAFTFLGKPYSIRCCFQIWTMTDRGHPDLRITTKPPTKHQDFWLGQYNGTSDSAHVFEHSWSFAVRRQGPGPYEPVFPNAELRRQSHWMLFEARSKAALERLLTIDFEAMSRGNALLPGFGKADVVAAYERILAEEKTLSSPATPLPEAANANGVCDAEAA